MAIDITSAFQGLSFSMGDLAQQISACGWELKKVTFDKKTNAFVATAKSPNGEEVTKTGDNEKRAVSNVLLAITRKHHMRTTAQWKIGMWQHHWADQLQPIAEAYAKANVYDPKAAIAFHELGQDSLRRVEALKHHIQIEETDDPVPYLNSKKMIEDIQKRRRLIVSRAFCDHPIWSVPEQVAFRAVHDVMGHGVAGGDFGWHGENLATAAHMPILSANAQKALFSEAIAKLAYQTHYRGLSPQKIALFPQFMNPVQEKENPSPGYAGVHPSQSFPPLAAPSVRPSEPAEKDLEPVLSSAPRIADSAFTDPNANWTSGFNPMQPNAYLDHGDPLQSQAVSDNAKLIDTEWAQMNAEDPGELAIMKQAIVNAFRVVLLSPRKDLKWNAIHYQHIAGVPADVSDPGVYWNTLEQARQNWNVARFGEGMRFAHMPYYNYLKPVEKIVYQLNPGLSQPELQKKVSQMLLDWKTEAEQKISAEDRDKPATKQRLADEVDRRANADLVKRMKMYIQEFNAKTDTKESATEIPGYPFPEPTLPTLQQEQPEKYGAFMGTHLKSLSQISQYVDDILKAALEDVHNHDGAGHHFRSVVLRLGVSGVGPKVCSFAWLLLQPMTSQLATIDTHMMDVLGHNFEKDMSPRDYFKFERELAAGRDAAGYSHVPLGQFQWGMWDLKRTGQGSHQDHSAMKILSPTPHDAIDWAQKEQPIGAAGAVDWKENWLQNQAPDWWQNTQPYRDQTAQDWDQNVAPNYPKKNIPYNANDFPSVVLSKVAASEELSHWWNEKKPIDLDDAEVLAEYAAAVKPHGKRLTKNEVEDFLEDHREDVHGNFHDFKEEFMRIWDRYKQSKTSGAIRIPWFQHPETGLHTNGGPGQSIMQHATRTLGLTTPEIWAALGENAGKSAGRRVDLLVPEAAQGDLHVDAR